MFSKLLLPAEEDTFNFRFHNVFYATENEDCFSFSDEFMSRILKLLAFYFQFYIEWRWDW